MIKSIRGGMICTDERRFFGDIMLDDDGKIVEVIQRQPGPPFVDETSPEVVDASGLLVVPGAIDAHVHFRDPGLTEKEDFQSGSIAAAVGGVTTVLDMPNTIPPVSSGELLKEKLNIIAGRSMVDYGIFGVLTSTSDAGPVGADSASIGVDRAVDPVDQAIAAVEGLIRAGACGIKLFMGPTTGDIRSPGPGLLYKVMRHFADKDVIFTFHCEDRETIEVATARLGTDLANDYSVLLKSRPRFGELTATDAVLRLALETGARVHIAHVVLEEAVEAIEKAKHRGARVTAETCPHYLFLSEDDYPRLGPLMKVLPPIRSLEDQEALWEGLKSGVIDVVSTDHAPHQRTEQDPSPLEGPFGASGVETLVPLMLDAATQGKCSVEDVVRWTAAAPARAYGMHSQKGDIKPGLDGDIVLIDPKASWTIDEDSWYSKSVNTPFLGRSGTGKPVMTIVRGHVIADQGDIVGKTVGRLVN